VYYGLFASPIQLETIFFIPINYWCLLGSTELEFSFQRRRNPNSRVEIGFEVGRKSPGCPLKKYIKLNKNVWFVKYLRNQCGSQITECMYLRYAQLLSVFHRSWFATSIAWKSSLSLCFWNFFCRIFAPIYSNSVITSIAEVNVCTSCAGGLKFKFRDGKVWHRHRFNIYAKLFLWCVTNMGLERFCFSNIVICWLSGRKSTIYILLDVVTLQSYILS